MCKSIANLSQALLLKAVHANAFAKIQGNLLFAAGLNKCKPAQTFQFARAQTCVDICGRSKTGKANYRDMCKPKANLVIIFAKNLYMCKLVANLFMNLHARKPLANLLQIQGVANSKNARVQTKRKFSC